ncbi:glycosyltransferase [Aquihabitans sp. G128]|uniref:glycosyltransferase n=1 Tax=Aquihabitans sp. G128 TaxID=2849779 RepID=UPI001C24AA0C|nr:glycosyltransferase [Aquihabitans sp. G128]QXC62818.1 glycosyltransferase [Aquihabitans sp. G128]
MDVLVCATQVPFRHAGPSAVEDQVGDLVGALTAAGHQAEVVLLPAAADPERLLDAALAWRLVPLDADLVVALDFPAYFARHRRKVTWLADRDRVDVGLAAPDGTPAHDAIWGEDLRQVVDWDIRALSEARARHTASASLADRVRRTCGLSASVLPAPPPLSDRIEPRAGGRGSFVLHVDAPGVDGRPGLFLAGLAAARRPVPGVVASLGPVRASLAEDVARLGLQERVHLPGRVHDRNLLDLLANAVAVVHAPAVADQAPVTLQAFRAGVPVITTADSGAVLEWVDHGVTGLVTDGSAEAMGAAITRLATDPELAARLGAAGRARVRDVGWDQVVGTLLAGARS